MVSRKNATVVNFAKSRVSIVFRASSRKFKILVFPVLLAHEKSYKQAFAKKYDGHKLCTKSRASRVSIGFSYTISEIQNTGLSRLISPWEVVQARFRKKIRRS
ncbi:hypothetical protein BHM03_00050908 [Ensete ventricosum]|uniref:Uncharacterized protein n=1 Tax=Ensete ventricosum TaxID=4639 RepID=A0A445MLT0_ENSVE|nr:hypothetical protein BHM03_00050908 [Ensete ventricosum]